MAWTLPTYDRSGNTFAESTISPSMLSLLSQQGKGLFGMKRRASKWVALPLTLRVGCFFFDSDLDGWQDYCWC